MLAREDRGSRGCHGGILADEMGLGKTWETIGLFLNNPVPTTLLLVPPVLQDQWSQALKAADIPHRILRSGAKSLAPQETRASANNVRLAAWTTVRGGRDNLEVLLATYDRAAHTPLPEVQRIVCDEGHLLRNGDKTKRFQALHKIEAAHRWILSGTPIQNRKEDFVNLLKWLRVIYDKILTPLSDIAADIMLRRTAEDVREDVAEFPTEQPLHVIHPVVMPADGEEKPVFDRLVARFMDAVETNSESWMILERYLRIRQFLAHPQIYVQAMCVKYKEAYKRKVWAGTASKMQAFVDLLQKTEKEPTLVFTYFKQEMAYVSACLKEQGYDVHCISGETSTAARNAAIRRSQQTAAVNPAVAMVIQIQAGNAGINLQHLTRIVFMSSHWNPAVVDQAVGRSYRLGQTKRVTVHHILLADGAEKNLDRVMAGKHALKRTAAQEVHAKLVCDSALDSAVLFDRLNEICPEEA